MIQTARTFTRAIFSLTLSLLYAIVCAGQVLGILKIYKLAVVIPFTALLFILIFYLYWRGSAQFFQQIFQPAEKGTGWLDIGAGIAGVLLVVFVILLPVIRWPYSPINDTLFWDAGLYHFPKAIEMVKTGSAWDLSISYGDYPYGYESVLGLPALITRNALGFGTAHALTDLFFILSFWLLLRRFSGLSGGVSLLLTSGVALSGFFPQIDANLWWIYKYQLYAIGMNDLFLAAALLAVVLHAPVGPRSNHSAGFPFGAALASMIALAVKPNAIFIVLPVWLLILVNQISQREYPQKWVWFLVAALVMMPGLLWAFRNLVGQGHLFSQEALRLQGLSIAANLTNPNLLNYLPKNLIFVVGLILITVIVAIFVRRIHWSIPVIGILLLAAFALTPASGFFPDAERPAEIGWRFAGALLAFVFYLPFIFFSTWLNKAYAWLCQEKRLRWAALAVVLAASPGFIGANHELLTFRQVNEIVLHDQFREPVGVNGYYSAYDYVQKNGGDSVVWVENGLPFYAYGPHFSNSVTRSKPAQFLVVFQTAWFGGDPAYPDYVTDPSWLANWQLAYEDSQGRVYTRLK